MVPLLLDNLEEVRVVAYPGERLGFPLIGRSDASTQALDEEILRTCVLGISRLDIGEVLDADIDLLSSRCTKNAF